MPTLTVISIDSPFMPPEPTKPGGFYFPHMKSKINSVLQLLFFITLVATASASEVINQFCPVTPEEPAESSITTEYKGQTIGFCCKSCLRKFNANSEAYLANLSLAKTDQQTSNAEIETVHLDLHEHNETATPKQTGEHDHSTDHAHSEESPAVIFLGKLHVLSVHLPIALLPIAAILEILSIAFRSHRMKFAARTNFVLGAMFAIVAATLGWIAASQSNYPGDLAEILTWHRWLGVSVASLSLVGLLGILVMRKSETWGVYIYRGTIFILLVLVPIAAHFGGSLIYGKDYLF